MCSNPAKVIVSRADARVQPKSMYNRTFTRYSKDEGKIIDYLVWSTSQPIYFLASTDLSYFYLLVTAGHTFIVEQYIPPPGLYDITKNWNGNWDNDFRIYSPEKDAEENNE